MLRRMELEYTWQELKLLAQAQGKNLKLKEFDDSYYIFFDAGGYIHSAVIDKEAPEDADNLADFEKDYKALCNESEDAIIQYKDFNISLDADYDTAISLDFDYDKIVFYIKFTERGSYKANIYYTVTDPNNNEIDFELYSARDHRDMIIAGEEQDEGYIFKRGDKIKLHIDKEKNKQVTALIINMRRA